jgi:hypothetical protein
MPRVAGQECGYGCLEAAVRRVPLEARHARSVFGNGCLTEGAPGDSGQLAGSTAPEAVRGLSRTARSQRRPVPANDPDYSNSTLKKSETNLSVFCQRRVPRGDRLSPQPNMDPPQLIAGGHQI